MLSIKFRFNQTYGWEMSFEAMRSSWISERDDFSNSEPLCTPPPPAPHPPLSPMPPVKFRRRCRLNNFKKGHILDIGTERFLQFWISFSHQCLQSSFGTIWLMVLEEMSFEEYQYCGRSGHLGYQNGMILAILHRYVIEIKFQLNRNYGLGGDVFEDFQAGHHSHHLGYRNGTILAILNLYVAPIPLIKF